MPREGKSDFEVNSEQMDQTQCNYLPIGNYCKSILFSKPMFFHPALHATKNFGKSFGGIYLLLKQHFNWPQRQFNSAFQTFVGSVGGVV